MRNPQVFALTAEIHLGDDYVLPVVTAVEFNKLMAKAYRNALIKAGQANLVGGRIIKLEAQGWTVVISDPADIGGVAFPCANTVPTLAEAQQATERLKPIFPPHFVLEVMRFDQTEPYKQAKARQDKAQNKGGFYA